ncbi:MAG: isoleucine--tRNA ligase [Candidatus Micrarchaeia archaeon]
MDLKANEESVLKYWAENSINAKIRELRKNGKKFYFLDGPPYASGELGIHHVWVDSTKDLVVRYKRYRGYNVHDRAGFDVHGLPIEFKVEKLLSLSSKKDIEEKIGTSNFIEKCRDYANEQVKKGIGIFERYGVSLDFENVYIPYKKYYMEKGWSIFKQIYDKGLVYEGEEPLAFCPHCETVLSAQGPEIEYQNESDPSLFVKFKVIKSPRLELPDDAYLAVWTTTPWTLVSNVAIAANPKELYVLASAQKGVFVVAKNRLDEFSAAIGESLVVTKEFYGSELEGTTYESLFGSDVQVQEKIKKYHKVILSESFVTASEGTGLLHVAPGHGPEDYKLGKMNKLPIISPIDDHARYTSEVGIFAGLDVPKGANAAVLRYLQEKGIILFHGSVTHSYPHCWRCGSKLIYRTTKQLYVNVARIKKKMEKANKKVKWYPSIASTWFEEAVKGSPDWCISRQRYWGTPIPLWKCDSCNEQKAVGSARELKELAGMDKELEDLHRQHVDRVTIKCEKCGGTMHRVKDIFDVWYDSGIAHTASLSDDEFARLFPADWISESADQIRGWFTVLLRTSVALYGKSPFERVSIGGMVKDELGQEMHRHLGNAISANEMLGISSVDGFRLWSLSHPRWQELRIKKPELVEANGNIITLYNIAELLKELNSISGFDIKNIRKPKGKLEADERWIVSRLNSVISEITADMDNYAIDSAVRKIRSFIVEDFSRFYLKFAKQRAELASKAELKRIVSVIAYLLKNIIITASIVIPFSTEHIYKELFNSKESIFMEEWPKPSKRLIDKELEEEFELLKDVSNAVLSLREKSNVKLRWPIASISIETSEDETIKKLAHIEPLLCMYANAKALEIKKGTVSSKEIKPLFSTIGPTFKGNAQTVAQELAKQNPDVVNAEIQKAGYFALHTDKGTFDIHPEHFMVLERTTGSSGETIRTGSVEMLVNINAELTSELRKEIVVREFIRRVQLMRKEMSLKKLSRIDIYAKVPKNYAEVISEFDDMIKKVTNAKVIRLNSTMPENAYKKEWELLDGIFEIGVLKV